MIPPRSLRPTLFLLCWALPGAAQGPLHSASIARRAHALTRSTTGLEAFGAGYKATLERTGVRLVPALGRAAARAMPVHVATTSIHRGATPIWSDHPGGTAPQRAGAATVAYDRAPGIRERWRVRPDGLELSYVFATRPAGGGDLVVRLALTSELNAEPMADGTVRLWAPGLGGVRIGAATGIDAAGATVRGALRVTEGALELSLPGAFVDRARYPLVLDPLFGPEVAVGNQTGDDSAPDVAYDASEDCYLVCWQEEFSALDVDIRAQRVTPKGAFRGGLLALASGPEFSARPTVANTAQTDRFLVVWQQGPTLFGPFDIHGANVAASSTATSSGAFAVGRIATSSGNLVDPDAAHGRGDTALVVWRDAGVAVAGTTVRCSASAVPPRPAPVRPIAAAAPGGVAISPGGAATGRHVVVWSSAKGLGALGVDSSLQPLGPSVLVSAVGSTGEPDVDGDGDSFLVAWHQQELGGTRRDVFAQKLAFAATSSATSTLATSGPQVPVAADAGRDERTPAVGWVGPKVLVAWSEEPSPATLLTYGVRALALSPDNCAACGSEWPLGVGGGSYDHAPRIAAVRAAGGARDEAYVVFASGLGSPPFTSEVLGQGYQAFGAGGAVSVASPSCGTGGFARVSGPAALGNSAFQHTLFGADPSASLGLFVLNLPTAPIRCGSCTVAQPLIVVPRPVVGGSASMPLPIGCEIAWLGATLESQWWVVGTANPCPLAPGVSFSNRLLTTIGL